MRTTNVALVAALVACTAAAACGGDASAHADQSAVPRPARVVEVSDTALVTVSHPERFETVAVTRRVVADRLSGTCVVTPDVNRSVPVNALGGGRVVELRARLGDRVRKGDLLVRISSPDLSAAMADHLKAVTDEELARKQFDRSTALFDHGTIARKDLEAAEADERKAQTDVHATDERVRMLGAEPAQTSPFIELRSPIDGTIVGQNIVSGAGVKSPDNAPDLFTIADLSRVWVMCDVYENDLPRARVGGLARIRLNAYPDRVFTGRIGNISPLLESATRTAKVRVELDNAGGIMRAGMFAVAELEASSEQTRPAVPATAIVQLHDCDWVFVKVGPATFRRIPIQTGPEAEPGVVTVLEGLSPGQQVVRDALQFSQTTEF
ncbi:MAG TPA: efflux RND transporter periplasmic adaptor subunit [Gemmatimonadaceae bacterium]|jgi:cobalt-zinc-cadmium efflux system membrane fusion protein